MRLTRGAAATLFFVGSVVAVAYLLLQGWLKPKISEPHGGVVFEQHDCYAALLRTQDRKGLYLENTCADQQALWMQLAANEALTQRVFDGVDRLYLGNLSFASGTFRECELLTRLASDGKWKADIDSITAAAVLERVLPQTELMPAAHVTLKVAKRFVLSASVETVLLSAGAAPPRCPVALRKVPVRAIVDLALGETRALSHP